MSFEEIKKIDWPSSSAAAVVVLKGVYFMSNSFEPLLEVASTDLSSNSLADCQIALWLAAEMP